jgi:transposase, IS30 family
MRFAVMSGPLRVPDRRALGRTGAGARIGGCDRDLADLGDLPAVVSVGDRNKDVVVERSEVRVGKAKGPYRWLTPTERGLVEQRLGAGERVGVIAGDVGCSRRTVQRVRSDVWLRRRVTDSGFRLGFEERVGIEVGIARGLSDSEIARGLGRHRSTVGREIARCHCRERYRAVTAQRRADVSRRRPKPTRLVGSPRLLAAVQVRLGAGWSPQQIARWLKCRYPDDVGMHISHETIYQSLYVQSRGELRRELTAQLRTRRTRRKPQGQRDDRGRIKDMVMIAERPPEVDDRRVPGHWEGDLLLGASSRSAVVTLVERQTRYVMLARLEDQTSVHVTDVLAGRIGQLPAHLQKSLTWDQGHELAAHRRFTRKTGIQVYFCDPHSPWQRGSNENTNGLLRQYLPKGTDLSVHSQDDLDQIAAQLNGRPRMTLDWWNPAQRMAQLLGEEVHPFPA